MCYYDLGPISGIDAFSNEKHKNRRKILENVEVKPAHEFMSDIIEKHKEAPIVLKMDIEGSEYECMEDLARHSLLSKIHVVIVEWHCRGYAGIARLLESAGFIWFNENIDLDVGLIRAVRLR